MYIGVQGDTYRSTTYDVHREYRVLYEAKQSGVQRSTRCDKQLDKEW